MPTPNLSPHTGFALTGVFIESQGSFAAYFAELPQVVADGRTREEAKNNLLEALRTMINVERDLALNEDDRPEKRCRGYGGQIG